LALPLITLLMAFLAPRNAAWHNHQFRCSNLFISLPLNYVVSHGSTNAGRSQSHASVGFQRLKRMECSHFLKNFEIANLTSANRAKLVQKQRNRLSREDRQRLEPNGRDIGRRKHRKMATIACADRISGWFLKQPPVKWTLALQGKDRPRIGTEIRELINKMAREKRVFGSLGSSLAKHH